MPKFSAEIPGLELTFETSPELFSPRNIDPGTAAMLRRVNIESQDKVPDLDCGYGVVVIHAARRTDSTSVWLVDVDPVAVETAKRNLRLNGVDGATAQVSDGFGNLGEGGFTKILCNPPYRFLGSETADRRGVQPPCLGRIDDPRLQTRGLVQEHTPGHLRECPSCPR